MRKVALLLLLLEIVSAATRAQTNNVELLPARPSPSPGDVIGVIDTVTHRPYKVPFSSFSGPGGTGNMLGSNNLSDVTNKGTARANLGVPFSSHVAKSANFSVTAADDGKIFDITAGSSAITVTLPSAATLANSTNGYSFSCTFRKADSGTGSFTVNGALVGRQGHTLEIWCDGTTIASRAMFGGFDGSGNIIVTPPAGATVQFNQAVWADTVNGRRVFARLTNPSSTDITGTFPSQDFTAGIVPSAPVPDGFLTNPNIDGTFSSAFVHPYMLVHDIAVLGDADATILNDGTITKIVLGSTLTAPRSFDFPDSHNYNDGAEITYYGAVGGVSPTTPITFSSPYGDTFSGAPNVTITKPYARVTFTLNLATHNWTYSGASDGGDADMPFKDVSGATIAIAYTTGTKRENNSATITADNTPITFSSAIPDGREGNLMVTQDATGNHPLNFPAGSYTGALGGGGLYIGMAPNAKTWIHWIKQGANSFNIESTVDLTAAAGATYTQDSETGILFTGQSATSFAQGKANLNKTVLATFLAGSSRTITRVDLPLQQVGSIAASSVTGVAGSHRTVGIYTDAVRVSFSGATTVNGSNTVTLNGSGIAAGDRGALITGPGIPANTYIGSVNVTAGTVTLSSSYSSNVSVNAGAAAGTGTVSVYGAAGTLVGTASGNVLASAVTSNLAADGPTQFTGLSAAVTSGTFYHVALISDTTGVDTSNYLTWAGYTGQWRAGEYSSSLSSGWAPQPAGQHPYFYLYH